MNKFGQRLLLWGVIVCFAVFFGVDMASKGISDTGGPGGAAPSGMQSGGVVTAADLMKVKPVAEVQTAAVVQGEPTEDPSQRVQASIESRRTSTVLPDTAMEGLAVSAGQVLRSTAQGGVELIVSLIDGILN